MNKKRMLSGAMLFLGVFSISNVWAVCTPPNGLYLEGGWGATWATGKSYPGVTTVVNSGTGANGTLGYKIIPYFAVEGGYTHYGDTRLENSAGTTAARDHHYGVDVALKGIYPIMTTGIELFAKIGVDRIVSYIGAVNTAASAVDGLTFNTSGHSGMGAYYGGGVSYAFAKNFAANMQYTWANGNSSTGNMNLLSIGLSFILDSTFY